MERLTAFLLLMISLVCMIQNPERACAELQRLPWTAADLISLDSGISSFRYGAFGTGIFPHDPIVPNRTTPVRLDGVPLPAISPFGVDLEKIPALFVDSLSVIDNRGIGIASLDSIPLLPQTRISFDSGDRRRSRFEGVFHRKISDSSAILAGGMSTGINRNETALKSSLRLYHMKYIHTLADSALATASIFGFRDRLDLVNLETSRSMGERTMDNVHVSGELKRYRLSKRTLLSASMYYRNGKSRFTRDKAGANFDDNGYGLAANIASSRSRALYALDIWSDARLFEGRKDGVSWKENVSGLLGSGAWSLSSLHLDLRGGGRYSGKYGAGLIAGGGLSFPLKWKNTGILRGEFSHEFPGPEQIFYPSLLYSDTLRTSNLKRSHTAELEAGIQRRLGAADIGLYAFFARSNTPCFVPVPASMAMDDDSRYSGARFTMNASGGNTMHREGEMRIEYIGCSSPRHIWPRPDLNMQARGSLSRIYFKGNLHALLYGGVRLADWRSGPLTPDGAHFFADSGLLVQVSSFTAFYQAENLTNTDMRWFDTLRWQGRNFEWGIRWSLRN